jgi:hypothetical protein
VQTCYVDSLVCAAVVVIFFCTWVTAPQAFCFTVHSDSGDLIGKALFPSLNDTNADNHGFLRSVISNQNHQMVGQMKGQ